MRRSSVRSIQRSFFQRERERVRRHFSMPSTGGPLPAPTARSRFASLTRTMGVVRYDRPSTQDRIPRTMRWRSSEKECHAETTTAAEPCGVPEPAPPASRDRTGVYGIAIKALRSDAYLQARQAQPALLRPDVIVRLNQRYRYNPLNQGINQTLLMEGLDMPRRGPMAQGEVIAL
jgi:hypothetical protein